MKKWISLLLCALLVLSLAACGMEKADESGQSGGDTQQSVDLKKAAEDAAAVTDDCSAVERLGMKVSVTAGSRENLKITTPFDLLLGTAILAARAAQGEEGDTK